MPIGAYIGQLIPLPFESRAVLDFTHILRMTYQDAILMTSGSAQAVVPSNVLAGTSQKLPAGAVIEKALVNVVTAFTNSGGAITTLTFSLGDAGSATRYVNAIDLKTVAWGAVFASGFALTAADFLKATMTIAGQTMPNMITGQVDVYLKIADLSQLVNVVEPSAT